MKNTQKLTISVLDVIPGDLFRGSEISNIDQVSTYVNLWFNKGTELCRLTRESIVTVER